MTTSPVTALTDELVAELERAVADATEGQPNDTLATLLAELAELKRRAGQGDWLIEYMASEREDLDDTLMMGCSENKPHVLRSIIDNQMELLK